MAFSRGAEKLKAEARDLLSEEDMAARIAELKSEIASLSKTLSSLGGQKVDDYRDAAERMAADAVSASLRAFDTARTEALSLEEGFEQRVRDNPLKAIGIAAGIGFLFALMTRR